MKAWWAERKASGFVSKAMTKEEKLQRERARDRRRRKARKKS
jgi:hypothetical protein